MTDRQTVSTADYEKLKRENERLKQKILGAISVSCRYSSVDGAHHKNWVIQEMMKSLCDKSELKEMGFLDEDWLEECIAP